ncbi:hypothetical protein R3Q06_09185 [Rhodococcus erythropolis]|uniref:hypothetical protein n=1 Tax=Rhodococcus erythropolis TaxID=1833 RepID=UPI0029493FBE|nr:hypothetical protein [Rhodococcus erythropolis]MDV6273672.1 hypothetical protein [Rhodococcus erythropolis]
MFVLTVDQRGSRRDVDRVGEILGALSSYQLLRPFERTAGDEIQAVTDDPALLVLVGLELIRREHWSVGIGIGPVEQPLPRQTRAGRGPAFESARVAVERAKRAPAKIAVEQAPADRSRNELAADVDAAFTLLGTIVTRQTKDGREAITLMDSGLTQVSAATQLGITKQAMSKRLLTAGWHAELAGRRLAERLLVRLQP